MSRRVKMATAVSTVIASTLVVVVAMVNATEEQASHSQTM
jgi:hypothetical protein